MKKIWKKFREWLIVKLGGMPRWLFASVFESQKDDIKTLKDSNKRLVADNNLLKLDNRFLRADLDDIIRENATLKCDNDYANQQIAQYEDYIDNMKAPKREFVNMEYVSMFNKATTEDELKFFAMQGLFDKIKSADVVKYDFRDGVCVASIEVVIK